MDFTSTTIGHMFPIAQWWLCIGTLLDSQRQKDLSIDDYFDGST